MLAEQTAKRDQLRKKQLQVASTKVQEAAARMEQPKANEAAHELLDLLSTATGTNETAEERTVTLASCQQLFSAMLAYT